MPLQFLFYFCTLIEKQAIQCTYFVRFTATSVSGSTRRDSLNTVYVLVSFLRAVRVPLVRLEVYPVLVLRPRLVLPTAAVIQLFLTSSRLHWGPSPRQSPEKTPIYDTLVSKQLLKSNRK